jgi:transposase InsO family protein
VSRRVARPITQRAKAFSGTLKTELIYPRNWQNVALEALINQIGRYIRWYNERRIKLSLVSMVTAADGFVRRDGQAA